MGRDSFIQWIAVGMVALCVGAASVLSTSITAEAGRAQLVYTDEASAGDPPEVALGVAMGAFRGLFVNYLWIRANKLKEEGKFYEAIQLSDAITKLQPRFPRVWVFHAWNMAYNISVATNTAVERWQWVNAGIRLLRDQAIPKNPNDVLLYKELAWTFIHKIQGFADDANHYYKRQLAKEWTFVLGPPPALEGSPEENTQTMARWFSVVADAPETLDAVIGRELSDRAKAARPGDPPPTSMVKELVDRIEKEVKLPLGFDLMRFISYRAAWEDSWFGQENRDQDLAAQYRIPALDALLVDEKYFDAWARLIPYLRKRIIIDTYHMEPQQMLLYTRKYGPLDWRHPASHAVYWSAKGVDEARQRVGHTEFDTLNTDRITLHALQELTRFGTINYDLIGDDYFTLPDFDWIDSYGRVMEEELRPRGGIVEGEERAYRLYGAGYENFLKDAIRTYYQRGDLAAAERYHSKLRNWGGLNINDSQLPEDLKLPLKDFVAKGLQERLTSPHVAVQEIDSAITDALIRGLLKGKIEVFKQQMAYAQKVRQIYLETQSVRTLADPESVRMQEYVKENFADIVGQVLIRILSGGGVPTSQGYGFRLGSFQAGQLYRRTPTAIQRIVYDEIRRSIPQRDPSMTPELFARIFPEPPDMAQYREAMAKLENDSDKAARRQIEFQKDLPDSRFKRQE